MKNILSLLAGVALAAALLAYGVTQEVPLGGLSGRVVMSENGRPLPGALITLEPSPYYFNTAIESDSLRTRTAETDENGNFTIRNLPKGTYQLRASANEHHLDETAVTVAEGEATPLDLQLDPNERRLRLYAAQRVFTPDETPAIELHGFVPADELEVTVHKLSVDAVAKRGGLQETISPLAHPEYYDRVKLQDVSQRVATLSHEIRKKDAEGAFIEDLDVPKLPEGLYWVRVRGDGVQAGAFLNITRIALVTKKDQKKALCFVTDVMTGQPIEGAVIQGQSTNGLKHLGATDNNGLVEVPIEWTSRGALVATSGASSAVCGFYVPSDIEGEGTHKIFTYTERPVYRPGDTIRFKSVVRKMDGTEMRLPQAKRARLTVYDPTGNRLEEQDLDISNRGTLHGSFLTSEETKPGAYRMSLQVGDSEHDKYVTVAAYRKPEFSVTVKPNRSYYVLGERASATVECKYYFGGPVAGAKVVASIYRSPHWDYDFDPEGYGYAEEYEGFQGGEFVEHVDAITDAEGRAVITFDTQAANDGDYSPTDYDYTVSVSAEEAGKYFDGQGAVFVARGNFDLDLELDRYIVALGESVELTVTANTHDEEPEPVPNQRVELQAGTWKWERNKAQFSPRRKFEAVTSADGTAKLQIPVSSGDAFRVVAIDSGGHRIEEEANVWVEGGSSTGRERPGSLKIKLDKVSYSVDDQLKMVLQTDQPGGSALITFEAEGILLKYVIPLKIETTTFQTNILASYSPNAYVSVVYVRNKKFIEASERLIVDRADRRLNISVEPDRPEAQPGETVQVTVKATESDGTPADAEISVGVVDESVYAIREDRTDIFKGFYPRRNQMVETVYSFPELYLDGGDKADANMEVRSRFLDTAEWLPTVQTGPSGTITVPIRLPDNLTSWRATVVGVTDDTAVGMGKTNWIARKDLMVRLQTPGYLVQGDEQRVVAIVSNDSGTDADVNVQLDVEGVSAQGDLTRRVPVKNGVPQQIELTLKSPQSGTATLTARAWIANGPSDAVRHTIEIAPHGREVRDVFAGEVSPKASFKPVVRPSADPRAGRLKVTITPHVASSVVAALDELVGFPYGCVEQTMSRFLPSILAEQMVSTIGLPKPTVIQNVPKIAQDGFARLGKMQTGEGGWGWWEYDRSDVFMTAYVLDGLDLANGAGYESTAIRLGNALSWAEQTLASPDAAKPKWGELKNKDLYYLAYSVLRHLPNSPRAKEFLRKGRSVGEDASGVALSALAFHAAGDEFRAHRDRAITRLRELSRGAASTHWEHDAYGWGHEATALALRALTTINPDDPLIPRTIRFLLFGRNGDIWISTRDTAQVLIGVISHLQATNAEVREADIQVTLNGREVRSIHVSRERLFGPDFQIDIPLQSLNKGDNRVEVRTTGGPVFYSADLLQYDVQPRLGQLVTGSGLTVKREYFLLEPRRMEDGTMRLMPSVRPVRSARSGDLIRCVLTLKSDKPHEFLMIQDPVPSNCRVQEREHPENEWEWGWWWSRTAIFDDHIAFFARFMNGGEHKIAYTMRAEGAGLSRALPVTASNMYDPSIRASSAETLLEVTR